MSLTKRAILEKLAVDKPERLGEFFGLELWVKSPTELSRSRRASSLYDVATGKPVKDAVPKSRIWSIIDSVCDKDGNMMFTDEDFDDLQSLDSMKIDKLNDVISEWIEGREKNGVAA